MSDYASGSSFPIGDTLVIYSAVDEAGNTGVCVFTVTVQGEFYIQGALKVTVTFYS